VNRPSALGSRLSAAGLLIVAAVLGACRRDFDYSKEAMALTGGDPAEGKQIIQAYGCGSCHVIPGIAGARNTVGPSLAEIGEQSFIAGVLQNTPDNMIRWIQDPQKVDSLSAMPNLGLTEGQARDVAAYLYKIQ
jgi:cytochrome c2